MYYVFGKKKQIKRPFGRPVALNRNWCKFWIQCKFVSFFHSAKIRNSICRIFETLHRITFKLPICRYDKKDLRYLEARILFLGESTTTVYVSFGPFLSTVDFFFFLDLATRLPDAHLTNVA